MMSTQSITRLTPERLRRIHVLKNNLIDLDVALDDLRLEIESHLTGTSDEQDLDADLPRLFDEQAALAAMLAATKQELAILIRRAA